MKEVELLLKIIQETIMMVILLAGIGLMVKLEKHWKIFRFKFPTILY
jgi:hypothetical protein